MSNARNISKADSRFVNATGDTIHGILNNESKVGIKVGNTPDTNLEVATRYNYNYAENMAIKVKNSESNYNNHMYLGSIGSSMIIDGARYYGGGAYLFEDSEASMIQMNNGATDFYARTGATPGGSSYSFPKVMGIDSAGRVTMPYQPSFVAYRATAGNVTYGAGANVSADMTSTNFNVGNGYNTSTGRFTAPVAGKYFFYCALFNGSGTNGRRMKLSLNGGGSRAWGQGGEAPSGSFNASGILDMAAGDYVFLQTAYADTVIFHDIEHSMWGGYLLG